MKIYVLIIIGIFSTFFSVDLYSQIDSAQARVDITIPNEHHEALYFFEGKWRVNYVENPDTHPSYGNGTSDIEIIYGARFIKIDNTLNMSDFKYMSQTFIGYDNARQKYTYIQLNNLSTNPIVLYGTYDKNKKEFVFTGKTLNLFLLKEVPTKIVFRIERENKYVYEFYQDIGKGMEMTYKYISIKTND